MVSLGSELYNTYYRHTNGHSIVNGATLPEWDDLPQAVKNAWESTAFNIETQQPIS